MHLNDEDHQSLMLIIIIFIIFANCKIVIKLNSGSESALALESELIFFFPFFYICIVWQTNFISQFSVGKFDFGYIHSQSTLLLC